MVWIQVKRILRSGLTSFWRNGFVSLSSVLVMIVTLFVISSIIFTSALLQSALTDIKEKVDVNVYFSPTTIEEQVLSVKSQLEGMAEVERVEYVSRDQALAEFRENHADDKDTLAALDELSENPLGAVLNVKAKETSQYEAIAKFLDTSYPEGRSIVEDVNYNQNKTTIDRLDAMITSGERLGGILTLIFILISIIITFNTIRLAIYISRDEINIMKLVGASNTYVRGPFVVIGALYGLVSAILTLILLWPIAYWLGPFTDKFFLSTNIFTYYLHNFGQMFLILVGAGVFIGSVSSYLAVKKYLR